MLTPTKLDNLWRDSRYRRVVREVLAGRPENDLPLADRLGGATAAAALTLLRLGELNQTALPLADDLRKRLLIAQNRDGSFGDGPDRPVLTALCVRAFAALPHATVPTPRMTFGLTGFGGDVRGGDVAVSAAVEKGIAYLAEVQHPDGGWGEPPAVAFDTGFVLLQLGRLDGFRRAVRLGDALALGRRTRGNVAVKSVWSHLQKRCGRTLDAAAAVPPARPEFVFGLAG